MKDQTGDLRPVRAWYGLRGEIQVENELWHLVRVGRVSLPHPPLINLFLRAGLPRSDRLRLSFEHEYGHLQTLPVAALHLTLLRPLRRKSLTAWLAALLAHQALWELAAESWVMSHEGERYRRTYQHSPLRPLLFAIGMLTLAVAGSWRALRH